MARLLKVRRLRFLYAKIKGKNAVGLEAPLFFQVNGLASFVRDQRDKRNVFTRANESRYQYFETHVCVLTRFSCRMQTPRWTLAPEDTSAIFLSEGGWCAAGKQSITSFVVAVFVALSRAHPQPQAGHWLFGMASSLPWLVATNTKHPSDANSGSCVSFKTLCTITYA